VLCFFKIFLGNYLNQIIFLQVGFLKKTGIADEKIEKISLALLKKTETRFDCFLENELKKELSKRVALFMANNFSNLELELLKNYFMNTNVLGLFKTQADMFRKKISDLSADKKRLILDDLMRFFSDEMLALFAKITEKYSLEDEKEKFDFEERQKSLILEWQNILSKNASSGLYDSYVESIGCVICETILNCLLIAESNGFVSRQQSCLILRILGDKEFLNSFFKKFFDCLCRNIKICFGDDVDGLNSLGHFCIDALKGDEFNLCLKKIPFFAKDVLFPVFVLMFQFINNDLSPEINRFYGDLIKAEALAKNKDKDKSIKKDKVKKKELISLSDKIKKKLRGK
jgi:hypothetical protein